MIVPINILNTFIFYSKRIPISRQYLNATKKYSTCYTQVRINWNYNLKCFNRNNKTSNLSSKTTSQKCSAVNFSNICSSMPQQMCLNEIKRSGDIKSCNNNYSTSKFELTDIRTPSNGLKIELNEMREGSVDFESTTTNTNSIITANKPVWSWNEWDPLKEIIVGRAEGQRIPFLNPDIQAKTGAKAWEFMRKQGGQPHDEEVVRLASLEVEEFCNILKHEGVIVKRPDPIRWDKLGTFNNPFFAEGGYMNACPRDCLMVVGDEIIESSMAWRSRVFETVAYKSILMDYFERGANWTCAPRPTMKDELYVKNFPFEDIEQREKMARCGHYILTESEIVFDAADALKYGEDIFITLSNSTNRSGVEWLRRHVEDKGIRVHSIIFKGLQNCHADATFMPLKPGLMLVNQVRPFLKVNDEPAGWEYFTERGWKCVIVPEPIIVKDMHYVSKWVSMNVLSLDEERVFIQKGEEPIKRLLIQLGMKPIEVNMLHAYELGGAFHCWTLDTVREGELKNYMK